MDRLDPLRHLLAESSDRNNPSAERIAELFDRLHRIAVVGLSRDPTKAARRVPSYLAAKGYEMIPVNPHADRILGKRARASLADVRRAARHGAGLPPLGGGRRRSSWRPRRDRPAPPSGSRRGSAPTREAAAARADGRLVVQDLCTYKVHRALYT